MTEDPEGAIVIRHGFIIPTHEPICGLPKLTNELRHLIPVPCDRINCPYCLRILDIAAKINRANCDGDFIIRKGSEYFAGFTTDSDVAEWIADPWNANGYKSADEAYIVCRALSPYAFSNGCFVMSRSNKAHLAAVL